MDKPSGAAEQPPTSAERVAREGDIWKALDACRDVPGTQVTFSYEAVFALIQDERDAAGTEAWNAAVEACAKYAESQPAAMQLAPANVVDGIRRLARPAAPTSGGKK